MKITPLFQKYLHGDDLKGQAHTVKIISVRLVQVQPHPTVEKITKLCLLVEGLPPDIPHEILVGAKNARRLVELFGDDTDYLPGKRIEIRPEPIRVAGASKTAIAIHRPRQAGDPRQAGERGQPGPGGPGLPPQPPDDDILLL